MKKLKKYTKFKLSKHGSLFNTINRDFCICRIKFGIRSDRHILFEEERETYDIIVDNSDEIIDYEQKDREYFENKAGGIFPENGCILKKFVHRIVFSGNTIDFIRHCREDNQVYIYVYQPNGNKTAYAIFISDFNIIQTEKPYGHYIKLYKERGQNKEKNF